MPDSDETQVFIPVTKEAIRYCSYGSCRFCAIAKGIESLLAPGYFPSVGNTTFDIFGPGFEVITTEVPFPDDMGLEYHQKSHPEGFTIPVVLPNRCLKEEVLLASQSR